MPTQGRPATFGAAGDGRVMPRYRVTYRHVRNAVTFEVLVVDSTPARAETAAASILTQHIRKTAGTVRQWAHRSTEEVEPEDVSS
jgi:hypothetical protein